MNKEWEAEEEGGISLPQILGIVRHYWLFIAVCVLVALAAAFVVNRYTTPKYAISSQILLNSDSEGKEGIEILGGQAMGGFNPWDRTFVNDKIQIIKSRNFMSRIVDSLELQKFYYSKGDFKSSEIYKDAPFVCELIGEDWEGLPVVIKNFEENTYDLSVENTSGKMIQIQGVVGKWYFHKHDFRFRLMSDSLLTTLKGNEYVFIQKSKETVTKSLSSRIKIDNLKETKVLNISLEEENTKKGKDIINTIAQLFVEKGLEDKNQSFTNTLQFINKELEKVESNLNLIELEIEKFNQNKGLVSISEQTSQVIEEWSDLEFQKYEQELLAKSAKNLVRYLADNQDLTTLAPSTFGITEPMLVPLIQNTANEANRFAKVRALYQPSSTEYKESQQALERAKSLLLENVKSLQEKSERLVEEYDQRVQRIEGKVNTLPEIQRIHIGLERKFKVQQDIYLLLLQKQFEYEIARSGNKSDYSVLNEAAIQGKTEPKSKQNYSIAFILGLAFPALVIFLRIFLNNKIQSREQLENTTKVPMLGTIPHSDLSDVMVFDGNSKAIVAESFRGLRSSLHFLLRGKETKGVAKVILVTSTVAGEGKTFCTLNLAHVLSLSGKRVLVVGLDLRKPRLHLQFDVRNDVGLSTYLSNRHELDEVIQHTEYTSLDIIPSGPIPPNPSELILGQRLKDALDELKKEYDYVLLDSAPIGLVADPSDLIPSSDLLLYVVREGYSHKNAANLISKLYQDQGRQNMALILNDSKMSGVKYGYDAKNSYGYGYGYGYSSGYGSGYGYYEESNPKKGWKKWWPFS